ncbi:MAG: DUF975 family protein [Methyloceanibacter sp.]|uniref:DUF975 family protein n=1 Tax=Methyloceanibacter sp. TaxID=1965321 RepID=UPI001DCE98CA|nr:DUF975 family protein [Methyloceanibacter sp.]MCB1443925.1 DUF975 family protein [Methyloceanibacter sp.]
MQFSPGNAIRFGWEAFKRRPWFFVGAMLILVAANIAASIVSGAVDTVTGGSMDEPTLVGNLVSYLLGILISMGMTAFFLVAHDNPDGVEYAALWHPKPFWNFFAASVLASLAVGIGLVLLIVPGLIAMVLFMFATLLVIDRGLGPVEAMQESMRLTKGYRWPLFGLILLLALVIFVGVLALGVGVLVAGPVAGLAYVHAYRMLSGGAPRIQPPDARLDI